MNKIVISCLLDFAVLENKPRYNVKGSMKWCTLFGQEQKPQFSAIPIATQDKGTEMYQITNWHQNWNRNMCTPTPIPHNSYALVECYSTPEIF